MSDTHNQKNYKADLFFFIPFAIGNQQAFLQAVDTVQQKMPKNPMGEEYLKMMDTVFDYEYITVLANDLKRVYLGDYDFSCKSDSTMHEVEEFHGTVMLFMTYSKLTNLALVTVASPATGYPLSFMLEEVNRNNGTVHVNGVAEPIDQYIERVFRSKRCGAMKHVTALSEAPTDPTELIYITMSEEYGTQDVDSQLKNVPRHHFDDVGQYENLNCYASDAGLTLVFNEYEEDPKERLYYEAIFLFTCEITQFKVLSITRTNRAVVDMLEKNANPSVGVMERLSSQFARTIRFWDTDNFRYLSTRKMAQAVHDAFQCDKLMDSYLRNQQILEHLISIRSAREDEKENKVLSFLAIALTLIQIVPLFYNIIVYILSGSVTADNIISAFSAVGATATAAMLVIILLKRYSARKL